MSVVAVVVYRYSVHMECGAQKAAADRKKKDDDEKSEEQYMGVLEKKKNT